MILAGDIGGTKTILALVDAAVGARRPLREETFASREHDSLESIVGRFLAGEDRRPTAASFGLAGRVEGRTARITNLPWTIDADSIGREFGIDEVHLLNDLEAVATAVPRLEDGDLKVLNPGRRDPQGVIGVIAPGTGLGEAFLTWSGDRHRAWPSEGGHVSFAPATAEQSELLHFLEARFGHVSFERVCSGSGFPNLYHFLVETGRHDEPDWLRDRLAAASDKTPVLMGAALEGTSPACVAALDLFVGILGSVVGNMALKLLPAGGLYLGGGIPPRILSRLEQPDFAAAIRQKGRFGDWVAEVPLSVILDPNAALHGATWDALDSESG